MPSGDPPPNYNWFNQQYGQIYVGDPVPQQDSAGNYGGLIVNQPNQLVLGGQPYPFTLTIAEPKDGDFRWNTASDCAEIFDGKAKSWIPILTGQILKDIYGEVRQTIKAKDSFSERFRDVIYEAEGIEPEESDEERLNKEYVEEMIKRVKLLVTEALRSWYEKNQLPMNEYQPNIVYSTSTGYLSGGST